MSYKSPTIVFLAELPWERQVKMARALRAKGVSVFLVYVQKPNNFDPQDHFDFAFQAQNHSEAVAVVRRLKPEYVHVFSYGADLCAVAMLQNKTGKVIYDYKDCYQNMLSIPMGDFFWNGQRFCVENADGLCCRDPQLAFYCRVNGIAPRGRRTLFLDYCWGERMSDTPRRDDGEVHTVLAGNFTVERSDPDATDHGYLHVSRELVAREIHVHIYPRWHLAAMTEKGLSHLNDYAELARQSPYFHLHDPVPMDRFTQELSQYDYGLGILQGALFSQIGLRTLINGAQRTSTPARWYDFLEAGLEVLASPQLHFPYRLFRECGVGIAATPEFFLHGNAKQYLLDRLGDGRHGRIRQAREKLDINRHIMRLIDFYKSL